MDEMVALTSFQLNPAYGDLQIVIDCQKDIMNSLQQNRYVIATKLLKF
jgi:hypothetical protein